jgi:hypothetical protein
MIKKEKKPLSLSKRFLDKFYKETDLYLNNFLKFVYSQKINLDQYKVKNTLNSTIYLCNNADEFIDNRIDKVWEDDSCSNTRIIYKELNTCTYIMSFSNLILIVFNKDDNVFIDFNLLYNESDEYLFDVYENAKYYYIFCVSKYKDEVFNSDVENELHRKNIIKTKFINWLSTNDATIKYTILTGVYDSFLVMNKHWNCNPNSLQGVSYLYKNIYIYKCSIGKGKMNKTIESFIKTSINMINKYYMPSLPYNYLNY